MMHPDDIASAAAHDAEQLRRYLDSILVPISAATPGEYRPDEPVECADCTPSELCREHHPDWRTIEPCAKCGESGEARNLIPCETHDRFYCLGCATDVEPCCTCGGVPTPCCAVQRNNGLPGNHPAAVCWDMCASCNEEIKHGSF